MVLAKALTNRRTTNCWTDVKKLERYSLRWHCHDHVSTMSQSLRQRSLWRQNIAKQKWKKNTEWGAGEVGTRYRMVVWLEEDNGFFFPICQPSLNSKLSPEFKHICCFYCSTGLITWSSALCYETLTKERRFYTYACVCECGCVHTYKFEHTHTRVHTPTFLDDSHSLRLWFWRRTWILIVLPLPPKCKDYRHMNNCKLDNIFIKFIALLYFSKIYWRSHCKLISLYMLNTSVKYRSDNIDAEKCLKIGVKSYQIFEVV